MNLQTAINVLTGTGVVGGILYAINLYTRLIRENEKLNQQINQAELEKELEKSKTLIDGLPLGELIDRANKRIDGNGS